MKKRFNHKISSTIVFFSHEILCETYFILEIIKHHLFLLAYPNSSAESGKIKPAQWITLRDTAQTTATARPGNTMPPI